MKSISMLRGAALGALLLCPAIGAAQEKKGKPANFVGDGPGKVHQQMEPMVGSWDVDVTYIFGGRENHGKAKCEAKWILDGRFLEQEYKSSIMGQPFTVLQHLGYDNKKKKTIELKMDNMSTAVQHNEGTISEDGKTITNEGESLDPMTGKAVKLRTVYTIVDSDHFKLEWFMVGADGKAEKIVSMTHSRRK
jgi:hypothetical protein